MNSGWLLASFSLLAVYQQAGASVLQQTTQPPLHIADLGDGRYQNPILHIDYSDPDVIEVDGHYYMTASSFNAAPGLPILHSTDLVNWELINYALPQIVPNNTFATPQHGNGVWAPNIRYHDGKFWIFYPDPDFGIYVTTAKHPAEKWSEPKLILAGKGIIDPTPLWDDDGKAYLLHAWAKSRAGFNNVLSLHQMTPDASKVEPNYTHIIDGNTLAGYRTLEGPKFYKRNGYYYVFAPAGGVETGWQSVFRAKRITGPYEARVVMEQGPTLVNGPHQGAWVHTQQNEDWFVHFQSRKAYGRIVHLQPMTWLENDWPVIGIDPDNDQVGQPVYQYQKPISSTLPIATKVQPTSDEFNHNALAIQWQWNANFSHDWYRFMPDKGLLRLVGQNKIRETGDNLWMTPSLLLQKLPARTFDIRAKINLKTSSDNLEGGLLLFGEDYAWVGIKQIDAKPHLVYVQCRNARKGCNENVHDYGEVSGNDVELRYVMASDATAIFSYKTEKDARFVVVGEQFKARRGRWVGAKTGLFSLKPENENAHMDVDYVRFTPLFWQ
ncbi:glycosyl hydrolase 43 family protein [Alteromonas sp. a30]|nr:glycosyl hydrolase 43 family protein [Alteromonas sp. a30]